MSQAPGNIQASQFVRSMNVGDDPSDDFRKLRFYLQANQKTRIALLTEEIHKAEVHYGRFYFYCPGGDCPACAIKSPSPRYLAWIYVYNTNLQGIATQPLGGEVKAFLFGRDKYQALSGLKAEWKDLRKLDILVECTDQKFQRMSLTAAQQCLWQSDKDFGMKVIQQFAEAKRDAIDVIARQIPLDQMAINMAGRPGQGGPNQQIDPASMLPTSAAAVGSGVPPVVMPNEGSGASSANQTLQDLLAKVTSSTPVPGA